LKDGAVATGLFQIEEESRDLRLSWVALLVNVTNGVALSVYPAAASNIRNELSLSASETGLLMSAFSIGYALVQIPAGFFSARYGRKQVMLASLAGTVLFTLLFAVANNFAWLFVARFLTGFSIGTLFPVVNHLLAEFYRGRKLQSSLGYYVAGYGAGTLFTFFFLSFLIQWSGWRAMVFASAGVGAILLVVVALMMRGEQYRRASLPAAAVWSWREFRRVFTNVNVLYIGFLDMMGLSTQIVVATWTPTFLETQFSFGVVAANIITGVMGLTTLVGSFFAASLSARFGKRPVILSAAIACLVLPVFIALAPSPLAVFVVVAVIGWAIIYYKPALFSLLPRFAPRELTAVAAGYDNTVGFAATFISPFVFGLILDNTQSYLLGYGLTSLMALLGVFGILAMAKEPPEQVAEATPV
jgi:predicted MFS family arabinose efflux permease